MSTSVVVDVDAHVLEPARLWEQNLEPRFRDRALRIRRDERGAEYLEIDGVKSRVVRGGSLGSFGALDEEVEAREKAHAGPEGLAYEESVPRASRDMQARLAWMDAEGIDVSVIYPSLFLGWHNECADGELALAYCRVYNDWVLDLSAPYADRILPTAVVPLLRIEDGVAELRRCADKGARGLYLNPVPMNGVPYGDPLYDPLWRTCQERSLPVALHVSNTPLNAGHHLYESSFEKNYWFMMMMYTTDCQLALTSFFNGAVFERFPDLSVGVVEAGCGWVAHWLEAMDDRFELGGHELLRRPPSEYFSRQCWISGDPNERSFADMARHVGADRLMWGSDYPHQEGHRQPVTTLRQTLRELGASDLRDILGGNAARVYGLR